MIKYDKVFLLLPTEFPPLVRKISDMAFNNGCSGVVDIAINDLETDQRISSAIPLCEEDSSTEIPLKETQKSSAIENSEASSSIPHATTQPQKKSYMGAVVTKRVFTRQNFWLQRLMGGKSWQCQGRCSTMLKRFGVTS